jgi:hypothetical protein
LLALLSVSLAGAGPLAAAEPKPATVQLVLRPASEPRPALRYRLLPGVLEQKPGNAAVIYNKIGLYLGDEGRRKIDDQTAKWQEGPLADLPRDEARKLLAANRQVLDDLELAARRERCDWELPLRERDFASLLLPEIQMTRSLARLLSVQIRLDLAEGRTDRALHGIQTGFALARHVAEGPTLVNGLVGIAIGQIMDARLEELIQQPGSPNLYWALTALPSPLIDLRKAIETEANMIYLTFPELTSLDDMQRSPAYWQQFVDRMAVNVARWTGTGGSAPEWQARIAVVALAIKGYPQAKRYLIERGRSPQEVEAMPVAQVVLVYSMDTYNDLRDRTFKWFYVPYWEARAGVAEAERQLKSEGRDREIVPLASLLLPVVGHVYAISSARSDRRIALLRTVEALRLHAAAHDGQLPARLSDVTEAPVPLDPMTGQAFVYRAKNNTAVLEATPPSGMAADSFGYRYEITLGR